MTQKFPAPSPTYIGPPANHGGNGNKPIYHIVIHSTVSPCVRGGARDIARYFQNTDRDASAHYTVDPGEVIQAAYDSLICYAAPPNAHKIHVEMCEMPSQDIKRWDDANHQEMFGRTVNLVARLCLAYDVPGRYVGVIRLKLGRRGITTHNNISQAFRQTTHWDPGAWPRRKFMRAVRAEMKSLRKKADR